MNPVVVVPGIKGSGLESFYAMDPTTSWSMGKAEAGTSLKNLLLTASGEADEWDDVVNRPTQLLGPAYAGFVEGLRDRLGVPVYAFPYDWRLSCAVNGRRLADFVEHLRTKPMRSVKGWAGGPRLVNLVGHSMGGLVARAALGEWGRTRQVTPPVDNLVFVATPHLGSLDAVSAMITGDTPILDFRKELRKLSRALPSVYELLPRFPGAVVDEAGRPLDVFDERVWQSNVTQPTDGLEDLTQTRLDAARAVLAALPLPDDQVCGVQGAVLCVVGNEPRSTMLSVPVRARQGGLTNVYLFDRAALGDGDGVVPVGSAAPDGFPSGQVEIPFAAAGFWPSEILARISSFHGFICTLDETQTVVARFLQKPSSPARKLLPHNLALGLGSRP